MPNQFIHETPLKIATDLILTRLVDIQQEFAKVDPAMVASLLEPLIERDLTRLYPVIVSKRNPALWDSLPAAAQGLLIAQVLTYLLSQSGSQLFVRSFVRSFTCSLVRLCICIRPLLGCVSS